MAINARDVRDRVIRVASPWRLGRANGTNWKVVRYLDDAHATEAGLIRVLQSQIAMTPRGTYRTALERHRRETRDDAERVAPTVA